jgi:lactate dehydrogenase-like 2-hydroxyacid dehydrogenase
MKIIILDGTQTPYVDEPDLERQELQAHADVCLYHVRRVSELPSEALDCDAIISWHLVPLDQAALRRFTRCRAIVRAAVGYDNIDLGYARQRNMLVANVPDYGTDEVADHTLAMALALLRKIGAGDRLVRSGSWDWRELGEVPRMADLRVGIVGLGRIGTAVAQRFKGFGCEVGFHDPYLGSGWEKSLQLQRFETLDGLINFAGLITLHVPLNAQTHHLIDLHRLQRMRDRFLINTARGSLIEPLALQSIVRTDGLRGLALDVYPDETQLPPRALRGDRVLWSPHAAFYSDAALRELRIKTARCVLELLLTGQHRNLLSPG